MQTTLTSPIASHDFEQQSQPINPVIASMLLAICATSSAAMAARSLSVCATASRHVHDTDLGVLTIADELGTPLSYEEWKLMRAVGNEPFSWEE